MDERALEEVVTFTSELIRIDTTNRGRGDGCERPAAEYVAERLAEAGLEPVLLEKAPGRTNVVARIAGSDRDAEALLVHGHLDVVPAEPADWTVHPFSGEIRDGVVWGRGAVDMKNADAMVLALVRSWARTGHRPRRDLVLAFTADEEDSAEYGSGFLADSHPELFEGCTEGVSESGAFTFHADSGMRLYPIAAGERGTAWLELTARGRAGHGSKVNRDNAVSRLAAAVSRIGEHAWPLRITPTVRAALTEIAALYGVPADAPELDLDAPDSTPARCWSGWAGPRRWSRRPSATAATRPCSAPVTRSTSSRAAPPPSWTAGWCPAARRSSGRPSTGSPVPMSTGRSTTGRSRSGHRSTHRPSVP